VNVRKFLPSWCLRVYRVAPPTPWAWAPRDLKELPNRQESKQPPATMNDSHSTRYRSDGRASLHTQDTSASASASASTSAAYVSPRYREASTNPSHSSSSTPQQDSYHESSVSWHTKQELRPTFSAAIVRTPDHYNLGTSPTLATIPTRRYATDEATRPSHSSSSTPSRSVLEPRTWNNEADRHPGLTQCLHYLKDWEPTFEDHSRAQQWADWLDKVCRPLHSQTFTYMLNLRRCKASILSIACMQKASKYSDDYVAKPIFSQQHVLSQNL
jgi:hypothetical protein